MCVDMMGPQPTLCGQTFAVSQATRQPALRLSAGSSAAVCAATSSLRYLRISEKGNRLFIAFLQFLQRVEETNSGILQSVLYKHYCTVPVRFGTISSFSTCRVSSTQKKTPPFDVHLAEQEKKIKNQSIIKRRVQS